ncbi:XrtA/PEP-CTERM system exopolysaccharide export protein [Aquisalimonas lutea]|uniref:XrtA/PEP-CTERM system exopolysaccharide export protein n=1 Tax=Aquisalimonas lutea TaxID=1327750 RepID=UPI003F492554
MGWARLIVVALAVALASVLTACETTGTPANRTADTGEMGDYVIGAGDSLQIHVRNNEDISVSLPVRPDGKISVPMVRDVEAAGRTTSELADHLEQELSRFIRDPMVTVMVTDFVGTYADQVRIIGQAVQPQAIAYREGMTVLDAIIQVGGLTEFAAGNRAKLVRGTGSGARRLDIRLGDLINDGDMSQNRALRPGDTLVIPEAYF